MTDIEIEFCEQGKDVLLIFTGIGGTTKGYRNKYETITKQVIKTYGFSVAVVTTPSGSWNTMEQNFSYVIEYLFNRLQNRNFDIYVMGSSAGANMVLSFSHKYPQIKRALAVNPVLHVNFYMIDRGIKNFSGEKINVVFGEQDPSFRWLEILPKTDKLQTTVLPNVDHMFTDNLETFIDLPKRFLFDDYDG